MEISVLILSCVILGLNPVLPVLLYLISRFVTLYGFYQIKYIHYCIDIVVPSGDHCCIAIISPSSDHYGTTKVAPPSDHLHTEIT